MDEFEISVELPVSAEQLFKAWISSELHGAFTGAQAEIEPAIGGKFIAWDGYIEGETLEMEPNRRIVQSWRTADFPSDAPDSTIALVFTDIEGGAKLTLRHSGLPPGDGEKYEEGWKESYFIPMKSFFGGT
jgi:uncharacterized protein YndB with AHSA1/START domain